ncbi:hypothetical protein PYCCODRAFT_601641 [Trametes coccinea BRFM310]|uniref:Uncharacterized protein n=1 Tax=Trametes coccinea (strain BRFM310) TaxID=1353009 RepID=A0A1Y2J583_TRAC3|nr:hypothetical protein PYCCODRAFT_601641 [Trametes coccinea BRFM310]
MTPQLARLRFPICKDAEVHTDMIISPYVESTLGSRHSPQDAYTAAYQDDRFHGISSVAEQNPVYPSPAYTRTSILQVEVRRLSDPFTPCSPAASGSRSVPNADRSNVRRIDDTSFPHIVELGSSPGLSLSRPTSHTSLRTPISPTRTDDTAYLSDATVSTLPPSYRTRRSNIPIDRFFVDPSPPPLPDYLPSPPNGSFPVPLSPNPYSVITRPLSNQPSDEQDLAGPNLIANVPAMPRTPRRSIDGGVSLAGGRLDLIAAGSSAVHPGEEHNTVLPPSYDSRRS